MLMLQKAARMRIMLLLRMMMLLVMILTMDPTGFTNPRCQSNAQIQVKNLIPTFMRNRAMV